MSLQQYDNSVFHPAYHWDSRKSTATEISEITSPAWTMSAEGREKVGREVNKWTARGLRGARSNEYIRTADSNEYMRIVDLMSRSQG